MAAYGPNGMFNAPNPGGTTNTWFGNNYSSPGYYPGNNRGVPNGIPLAGNTPIPSMNNILQVMGVDSAREYKIGPNSQVILMDSNRPIFYIKRSDDSGYSEIKAYEFHEIDLNPDLPTTSTTNKEEYVQKSEFEKFKESVSEHEYITKSDFEDFKKKLKKMVTDNEQSDFQFI